MTVLARLAGASGPFGGRRAGRVVERNVYVYRRGWFFFVSGFLEPVFYLLSIGLGIGALVGSVPGPNGQPIAYAAFVAPAMMASAAMNGSVFDSTYNFFFKLRYEKTFDAMLATPLGIGDVALGEVAWSMARSFAYSIAFFVITVALGLTSSPWAILALPSALLIGFATSAIGMAATTFMRSWTDFDLIIVVTLPLFLFSGTFYPVSAYPGALQVLVALSPLYHGVELVRGFTTGIIEPVTLAHAGFLVALGLAGMAIVRRRLHRLLLQ
jgi:lipooligosaccharide transport system permease protein